MLLSGRILIGEMSFSPTRQLSLVAIMVLLACIVLMATDMMNAWGWMSYDWAGTLEWTHGRFTLDTYEQF